MQLLVVVLGLFLATVGFFLFRKWAAGGICNYTCDLSGKVIVITGANTGLGYQTALDLALMGGHIILACRDEKKAKEAAKKIEAEIEKARTENEREEKEKGKGKEKESGKQKKGNKGSVEVMQLDLASFASIRKFVEEYKKKRFPSLDILINNAGVFWCPYMETEDHFEMQFGVNHLGHFLLTLLLLDELKKNKDSRIINVTSRASETYLADIHWDDLNMTKKFNTQAAYAQSKLANVLFTEELNRKLRGTGVTTYAVHPGAVSTDVSRHLSSFLQFLVRPPVAYLFPLKTPKQGAQTVLFCAIAPNIEKYSGMYFADCEPRFNGHVLSRNEEAAQRLWTISEKYVQQKFDS